MLGANQHTGRSGQYFTCKYCGEQFYRRPSHIKRGITKSCGKSMCKSAAMSGENNPFWGKAHDGEARKLMKAHKTSKPKSARRGKSSAKGYRHTEEAKRKISEAGKKLWAEQREKMLAACRSVQINYKQLNGGEPRYRLQFTPLQRKEWKDDKCCWCDETKDLVIDHIIPVMAGGTNIRENAQTLCRGCNLWKMKYIDRPLYFAKLAIDGG